MDTEKKFEKELGKIDALIALVKEHTAGMEKASFLSAIGTVMKAYSLEHDIPMKGFVIEFMTGVFAAEDALPGLFDDADDD